MIMLPKQCQYILDQFAAMGHSAYLVGGCVRDSILGATPKDWDICTSALPEETLAIFSQHKVILTGLQHGTVTILLDHLPVEVTTYRIDGEYLDNRRPKEVFFTQDLRADLSRRDFTINALAYNPATGIIDYFGGLSDLEQGIIRAVGDATARYQEDGLRLMRAIRFACVLNFEYETKTKEAIIQCNHLLNNIAMERIQSEFNKLLLSPYVARGLNDLYELGCFAYFMPEICHTYGFEQNNPYHCFDVFRHTVESVAAIEPTLPLRLAMLLHDIGKPFVWCQCFMTSDCFPGHEACGERLAQTILERLRYDRQTQRVVTTLVGKHTYQLDADEKVIRQALALLGAEDLKNLIKVKRADLLAQKREYATFLDLFDQIETCLKRVLLQDQCYSLKQLAINGQDLLALGYHGPRVGLLLEHCLGAVIHKPELNQKDRLLALLAEDPFLPDTIQLP